MAQPLEKEADGFTSFIQTGAYNNIKEITHIAKGVNYQLRFENSSGQNEELEEDGSKRVILQTKTYLTITTASLEEKYKNLKKNPQTLIYKNYQNSIKEPITRN